MSFFFAAAVLAGYARFAHSAVEGRNNACGKASLAHIQRKRRKLHALKMPPCGNSDALYGLRTAHALIILGREQHPYALADRLTAASFFRYAQPVQRTVAAFNLSV